jgi:hypothetical protein
MASTAMTLYLRDLMSWLKRFRSLSLLEFLHKAEWQISTDASKNRGFSHFRTKQYKKSKLLTNNNEDIKFFEMAVTISRNGVAQ